MMVQLSVAVLLCSVAVVLASPSSEPGPHFVGDSPQARSLFYLADLDHNQLLTRPEFHSVFLGFDKNSDARVTLTEFMDEWNGKGYGSDTQGIQLFLNLDANKDTLITEDIDMPYIFRFFDRNVDSNVTEGEFVTQWVKISS